MRNLFILLHILLFCDFGNAQYTLIPDPNFEQFLETNGMGDGVENNGQVLTANIENVTELIINSSSLNIHDVTGIQDFTMLEILGFSFNPITELDLSQNTHLKMVGLVWLFSLETLNVTGLKELVELHVIECLMPTVILGSHPDLTYIDVTGNTLSSLDVTQCPALEYIDITENHINQLDISQNPLLNTLVTSLNPLASLDTSSNPELEIFRGSYATFSSYDFSENPNLRFVGMGNTPNLTSIDMRNGNNSLMDSFHIGQSENLKCIYVDDASAPYLEDWHTDADAHFVNNEEECEALQTQDFFIPQLQIYPNPVLHQLNILNPDLQITDVQVTDVSGKLVLAQKISTEKIEIDFSNFPKGIYFISAETNGKKLKTQKIIKK